MRMPGLRFKADDGSEFPDWEERTSVELCSRMIGGGTPSTSNTDNYNGDISWISSSDLDVDNITTVRRTRFITERAITTSATKKVKPGSIAVVLRVGVGKVALLDRETCTSQDFISLEDVTGDTKFIAYMLSARMQREAVRTQGTSIKGIPATRFKELTYRMPSSIIEQRKIADLLSTVDDVIAVQQAEVDAWEQRKKGVMQKLFSQEVRFKADDGSDFLDWDEKTLGELTNLFVGKSFTSELSENGHYVVMDMGSVSPDGSIIDTKLTDSTRDLLDKDDLIMPKDDIGGGLIIGKTAYIPCDGKYVCGDHVYRLRFGKGVDGLFMHYDINSTGPQKRLARKVTGSAQLGLNSKNVSSETISIPSLSEQRKIANCLSSIDDVIAKEKAELAKWQELKKGLLQQMFV